MRLRVPSIGWAGGSWAGLAACALSLSIGWGIRGNFGHENGAMIPGALAALAACIFSGREDWRRRAPHFACLGALGWAFGGSMSYMMVISYTHSGHHPSQLYGFASLFLLGFLWAALGGAGTALAASADGGFLRDLYRSLLWVLAAWTAYDLLEPSIERWLGGPWPSERRHESPLYWLDSDWIEAAVALAAVLLQTLLRAARERRWRLDRGGALILHLAAGWWIGFLLFPVLLGLRMTPPRGDDWAGILGLFGGAALFLLRHGQREVLRASLESGLWGGIGFSGAALLKLILVAPGNPALTSDPAALEAWSHWQSANWHSFLEQSYGSINGVGIALALGSLARRSTPRSEADTSTGGWPAIFATSWALLAIPYLNFWKNVGTWKETRAVPPALKAPLFDSMELSAEAWFQLASAAVAFAAFSLMLIHRRRPLPAIPQSPLGRGQLLWLALLAIAVVGNWERALVSFGEGRLITEGVILLNSLIAAVILLAVPREAASISSTPPAPAMPPLRALLLGLAIAAGAVLIETETVRAIYGNHHAGHAGREFRFGPDATWKTLETKKGKDHP